MSKDKRPLLFLFAPDAGSKVGVGHVMRCMALAEELVFQGHSATFVCDLSELPWVARALVTRGIQHIDGRDSLRLVEEAYRLKPDILVFDSYRLPASSYNTLGALVPRTLAFIDNELRGAQANLYLDQNIGSDDDWSNVPVPQNGRVLAGLNYALIRADVRERRPHIPRSARRRGGLTVLSFFGGSDATGMAPVITKFLAKTGIPMTATVITRPDLISEATSYVGQSPHNIKVIGPVTDLAERISASDLVISASGSSAWELAALGAAAIIVPIADNQLISYQRAVRQRVFAGLGPARAIRECWPSALAEFERLAMSHAARTELHWNSWHAVDGVGAQRVASELVGSLRPGPT